MTQTSKWIIDPHHSGVRFKVKHLMVANLSGTFKLFSGAIENENEDFDQAEISFEVDANSVDTYHEIRDGHLKSPDFLDTEKFPKIIFNGLLQKKGANYELLGEMTLRDIKKSIKMDAEFTGAGKGRHGDTRAGFEVSGKINRKDFGIDFGLLTETGSLVVGEDIKLYADIELIKQ